MPASATQADLDLPVSVICETGVRPSTLIESAALGVMVTTQTIAIALA